MFNIFFVYSHHQFYPDLSYSYCGTTVLIEKNIFCWEILELGQDNQGESQEDEEDDYIQDVLLWDLFDQQMWQMEDIDVKQETEIYLVNHRANNQKRYLLNTVTSSIVVNVMNIS